MSTGNASASNMSSTEWQGTGEINRDGAWGFFIIMNFLAIVFNSSLVYSIWRLKNKKTSTEVLIGGLASGIIIGAFGCGPQCFINTVSGTFAYGSHGACFTEAFLHLVGMEIQFICVAALAHRTYVGVVLLRPYPTSRALAVVITAWVFAPFATMLSGNYSRYYLVASGTFCFYEWASPALIFVAWPLAIMSAVSMAYWYWFTFKSFAVARNATDNHQLHIHSDSGMGRDLAIRLSSMVLLLGLGYVGIISQSMYELFVGRAKAWGDIVAAILVLIFWVGAPFAYSNANRRLGIESVLICLPKRREENQQDKSGKRSPPLSRTGASSQEKKSPQELERSGSQAEHMLYGKFSVLETPLGSQEENTEDDPSSTHRHSSITSVQGSPFSSPVLTTRSLDSGQGSPAIELSSRPIFNPFQYQPVSPLSPPPGLLTTHSISTDSISANSPPSLPSPSSLFFPPLEPSSNTESLRLTSNARLTGIARLEEIVPEE